MKSNQEKLIRFTVREQMLLTNSRSNLDMLTEGIATDLAKDAIQFAVGAAAEYGLGAVTLPAYGAGLAVGPASETVVDAAFAAKDVADGVQAVVSAAKSAGEFAGMLGGAIKGFGGDFDSYYDKLKQIVQDGLEKFTKGDYSKVDEIVEKLKEAIRELIAEIVGPIEKGIKLIIPDASIGLAAAKAVGQAIKSLSENAYSGITTAIKSVDMLNDAVTNPDKVVKFFKEVLTQLAEMLNSVGEYLNDMSWAKALLIGGPVTGTMLKKLGPDGMEKLSKTLTKATPEIISIVNSVVKKVMPALFASLGIYQILVKGEYKKDGKGKKDSKDNKSDEKETKSESLVRLYIRESFSSEDFKDVYNTARMAHVGQIRRDGSEYFSHPSEVRNITRGFYSGDKVAQLAALLHDSLEDAPGSTVESAEEMEDFIRGSIQNKLQADEVIRVVRALTHEKGGDYVSYVVGLMGDIPTLRVKLSDMVHNLSDNPSPKQKAKYKTALDAISDQTGGRPPRGISRDHWNALFGLVGEVKRK